MTQQVVPLSPEASNSFNPLEVFNALSVGLIMVNPAHEVLLWNQWVVNHSQVPASIALQKKFVACFEEDISPALLAAINNTLTYGLPAVLSTALHRSLLPLYEGAGLMDQSARIPQSIATIPIASADGGRLCLIQVRDSSTSIKREKMLRSHSDMLRQEATTDSMTGVYNRRFFDEHLKAAVGYSKRQKQALSAFMIDVDCFKEYNDSYGHLGGDKALTQVAHAFKSLGARTTDIVARYGGEEFVLLMPSMGASDAQIFAEKLRAKIWDLNIPHLRSPIAKRITVSVGASTLEPETNADALTLLATADRAMYMAKKDGRNQCHFLLTNDASTGKAV